MKIEWYWHKNRHNSMEQNREARYKPTLIQSIYYKCERNIQWRKHSLFNKWMLEKLDKFMQKNETKTTFVITYTNKLKID